MLELQSYQQFDNQSNDKFVEDVNSTNLCNDDVTCNVRIDVCDDDVADIFCIILIIILITFCSAPLIVLVFKILFY